MLKRGSKNLDILASFMGCWFTKQVKHTPGYEEPAVLAAETAFTVSDVEALYELFRKISYSIIKDGLIHKEEFQLALFKNSKKNNLFADRIFDLFDLKRNGVIDFGEFVRSLSVFHPNTAQDEKIACMILYDLRSTGFIEREEQPVNLCWFFGHSIRIIFCILLLRQLKEMVLALLNESELCLSDDIVETIVDQLVFLITVIFFIYTIICIFVSVLVFMFL
ncbi:hypothetical protein IEQ34_020126 [Dendrobium chrysotoxum]|uniref:Calcineurin B-like protein n=1 Tax=Dendrobium chrysotoxum TaxID=161865 RepID=A0AAV7G1K8_DENCH|nr:hypothetical protein IEQ34_020126 [Dendrobium chrysotoxum]